MTVTSAKGKLLVFHLAASRIQIDLSLNSLRQQARSTKPRKSLTLRPHFHKIRSSHLRDSVRFQACDTFRRALNSVGLCYVAFVQRLVTLSSAVQPIYTESFREQSRTLAQVQEFTSRQHLEGARKNRLPRFLSHNLPFKSRFPLLERKLSAISVKCLPP